MKALSTLLALAAIVYTVILSANLFVKEEYLVSSSLIIVWIGSIILWVKLAAPILTRSVLFIKSRKA